MANNEKPDSYPPQDVDFLMACMKNVTGGVLSVDAIKIAHELGYQNPRSVTNKISLFKKKYGLPLTTAGGNKSSASAGDGGGTYSSVGPNSKTAGTYSTVGPISKTTPPPKTPKGRISKTKAAPRGSAKKTPAKKTGKEAVKAEADGESEGDASEEMEFVKATTVKTETEDDEA